MFPKDDNEMRKKRTSKKLKPAPKTKYRNKFMDELEEDFSDEDYQSALKLSVDDLYDDDLDDDRY
jgi:hypothetical protein